LPPRKFSARFAQVGFSLGLHRSSPVAPRRSVGNVAIGLDPFAKELRAAQ
jgi:hypothetical protein